MLDTRLWVRADELVVVLQRGREGCRRISCSMSGLLSIEKDSLDSCTGVVELNEQLSMPRTARKAFELLVCEFAETDVTAHMRAYGHFRRS